MRRRAQTSRFELRLLGASDLRHPDGHSIESLLRRPKLLALLAYLAAGRPRGFHQRQRLLGLFWPEVDEARGRNALGQSLHILRSETSPDLLISRGTEIGLDGELMTCDVLDFEDSLDSDRAADALALYRGELLPAFFLPGAAGFERWLEEERAYLRRRAATAAWALSSAGLQAGDRDEALSRARSAVAIEPYDERGFGRLMSLLDQLGDRAGALQAYEAFARNLRREFDSEPTAETRELAEGLRSGRPPPPETTAAAPSTLPPAGTGEPRPDTRTGSSVEAAGRPAGGGAGVPVPTTGKRSLRQLALPLGGLVAAGALITLGLGPGTGAASSKVDPGVVAVFPFRTNVADSSLAYLGEGIVDVLSLALGGEAGRAVEPDRSIRAWKRATNRGGKTLTPKALEALARSLGAGRYIEGSVVGGHARLLVLAKQVDITGARGATSVQVAGPEDSLAALADQLLVRLLSSETGSPDVRRILSSSEPRAILEYLAGRASFRRGQYDAAVRHDLEALRLDTTLAVAGLNLASAQAWTVVDRSALQQAYDRTWGSRGRLSRRDSLFLTARLGPRYPDVSSVADFAAAWRAATDASPDRPEAWYEYGDLLFHRGTLLGMSPQRVLEEAGTAFRRAAALDPDFAAPLAHLVEIAGLASDRKELRKRAALHDAGAGDDDTRDFLSWYVAAMEGDSATRARLRARLGTMPLASVRRIVGTSQLNAVALEDADAAAAALLERSVTLRQRESAFGAYQHLQLNRGRPAAAARILAEEKLLHPAEAARVAIFDALYGGGLSAPADSASSWLRSPKASRAGNGSPGADRFRPGDWCALGHWEMASGGLEFVRTAIDALRRPNELRGSAAAGTRICALLLAAALSVEEGADAAPALVAHVDSVLATGPLGIFDGYPPPSNMAYTNLLVARLWRRLGNLDRALAAVRRRPYLWQRGGVHYLSESLRLEGELAEAVGDRSGAVRAYRAYLALRSDPEPEADGTARKVRASLERLESAEEGLVTSG